MVTLGIGAHGTQCLLAQVSTPAASLDRARSLPERLDKRFQLVRFADEQVKSDPLRGPISDPGKFPKGLLKLFKGGRHAVQKMPGI